MTTDVDQQEKTFESNRQISSNYSHGDVVKKSTTSSETTELRNESRKIKISLLFVLLTFLLVIAAILSASMGQLQIPPNEIIGSIMHKIGINVGSLPTHPSGDSALWTVRFPRVVMTIVVGAALACAGAVMQGIFGNPLAEPGVVGVSSGAAVFACATIVFDLHWLGNWTTAIAAFAGGLLATALVYVFSRSKGRTEVVTLILTGVAINAVCGAALAYLTFMGDTQAREQIVFWQLGSFNGTRWENVLVAAVLVFLGVTAAVIIARRLDLLALGDRPAAHLGVNVELLRIVGIVVVALITSAAVAFVGIISFVGLVVPHLMRMIIGPGHKVLIPASIFGGAILLTFADLVARTAVSYADLPIGMLTALVGGPFFFWFLRRTRSSSGGWM